MTSVECYRDSINGSDVTVCPGVAHAVLREGRGLILEIGRHVLRCKRFFIVRQGNQIWLGRSSGHVLSALIEEALIRHGKEYRDCTVLLPLDNGVYCVVIGSFGIRVSDSERIVKLAEALKLAEAQTCHVISGGRLSKHFEELQTISIGDSIGASLDGFKLRPVVVETLYTFWESRAALALAFLTIVLTVLVVSGVFTSPAVVQVDAVPMVAPPIVEPMGEDTAVAQLRMLHRVLQLELPYFRDKGIRQLSYDSSRGVTLSGGVPAAMILSQFISDIEAVSQDLLISQDRWILQADAQVPARPEFELPGFNRSYAALLFLRDVHGFSLSMAATSSDSSTKNVSVELGKNLDQSPNLAAIADLLEGHAVKLQSMLLALEAGAFRSVKITLRLRGRRV